MRRAADFILPIALIAGTGLSAQEFVPPMTVAENRTIMNVAQDVLTDEGPIKLDSQPVTQTEGLTFAAIGESILTVEGERIGKVHDVSAGTNGQLRSVKVALDEDMPGTLDMISLSAQGAERTQGGVVLTLSQNEVYQMIDANAS